MDVKNELLTLKLPRWEQIPEIGLYMDQLLNYLNASLRPLSMDGTDLLTSSMVNNYVKNSIVKKPIRKLYKRYHIAFLIIVILIKQCFSLAEVSEFIQIYSNIEDSDRVAHDFNKAVSIFESILRDQIDCGHSNQVYFESPTYEQQLMLHVLQGVANKIAAQALVKCQKSPQEQ